MRRWSWLVGALALGACSEVYLSGTPKPADDTDTPEPDIALSPATLQFGTVQAECTSEEQLVTVSNVGTAPLVLSTVRIEGADRAAFDRTDPLLNLAPGETTDVRVAFTPPDLGTYELARLVFESNDPDEGVVKVGLEGEGGDSTLAEDLFVQEQSSGVDVLFLLDKSTSMGPDIEDLKLHFATFINLFLQLGLDYHLAVMSIDEDCPTFVGPVIDTTTPDPAAEFAKQVDAKVCDDNETTFDAVTKAFSPPHLTGANAGFLRPAANLALVVFSDEPEQSGELLSRPSPASFLNFLASLKGGDKTKVTFSGLVGPETLGEAANCLLRANPALPDDRYQKAIRQSGGYLGRICDVKVQPFLGLLSRKASGIVFDFTLSQVPLSLDLTEWEVAVGTRVVPQDAATGWTYDAGTNQVTFHGTSVPGPGESFTVRYPGVATCN